MATETGMTLALFFSCIGFAAWLYLLVARGGFWRADIRDEDGVPPAPGQWPSVAAIVPARNEADVIEKSLSSLLRQDYPAPLHVVLVDDQSEDGTSEAAHAAAEALGAGNRLMILKGEPLPPGWTGKLWAMNQGVACASAAPVRPRYLLLTDADISYAPGVVRRLVSRAEAGSLALTSLMVKLRCESLAERALIPAFVFFFQMLYPFAWVNRRDSAMAAAAGGCMLARLDALEAAGGIQAIRSSLIDDCALGRSMKKQGPVLARLDGQRAQPSPLSPVRGYSPHGRPLGLRSAQLFAAATGRDGYRDAAHLPLAALVRGLRDRACASPRRRRLGPDGGRLSADRPLLPPLPPMGHSASRHRSSIYGVYRGLGIAALARAWRALERPRASAPGGGIMNTAPVWEAGEKTHRDENFPVASHLIAKQHRPPILAYYRFARAADDVADHPALSESEKIRKLDQFEETLLGQSDAIDDALPLRAAIAERGLSPKHGQDLLAAFRMDASKQRYADWNDLIHYCSFSAMPVGRFVLDVHGESRATWPANDALCAALQIINHLQDCGADYRRLDRVYIPLDSLRPGISRLKRSPLRRRRPSYWPAFMTSPRKRKTFSAPPVFRAGSRTCA